MGANASTMALAPQSPMLLLSSNDGPCTLLSKSMLETRSKCLGDGPCTLVSDVVVFLQAIALHCGSLNARAINWASSWPISFVTKVDHYTTDQNTINVVVIIGGWPSPLMRDFTPPSPIFPPPNPSMNRKENEQSIYQKTQKNQCVHKKKSSFGCSSKIHRESTKK